MAWIMSTIGSVQISLHCTRAKQNVRRPGRDKEVIVNDNAQNNSEIKNVNKYKYLGFVLDQHLMFVHHVDSVRTKVKSCKISNASVRNVMGWIMISILSQDDLVFLSNVTCPSSDINNDSTYIHGWVIETNVYICPPYCYYLFYCSYYHVIFLLICIFL